MALLRGRYHLADTAVSLDVDPRPGLSGPVEPAETGTGALAHGFTDHFHQRAILGRIIIAGYLVPVTKAVSSATGEFSFAGSGYLYRDGKIEKSVKGFTLSGNYYKLLNERHAYFQRETVPL